MRSFFPSTGRPSALIDYAAAIAGIFEAHLDGIACVYQTMNPMIASEAAAVVMSAEYDTSAERVAVVLDQFEITTRALGIAHDAKSTFNVSYAATRTVTEMSRLYDLNIVAQPDRDNPSQTDFLSEAVLFGSGRPMLMVPYIARGPAKCDRVLICWDGSIPAARAVHDAMPFLHKATTIEVVAVNEDENASGELASSALIAHLARRDLSRENLPGHGQRFQYSQRHSVAGCRQRDRPDRDGRLWSFQTAGIHPGGNHARHLRNAHGPGIDLTLIGAASWEAQDQRALRKVRLMRCRPIKTCSPSASGATP